ncbi:MAG: TonB-dependent receptor [Crocinitomicaceae bacterium]|nr:TonB-dependent receptor [Crocinitomicaceae bacterium]|tara:strand:- start:2064 stop:4424 length:2361 start_codon:yes stop_codon:yes gene_type:complete
MKFKIHLVSAIAILLLTNPLQSQDQTSTITGVVVDKQSGFTIPGANVVITTMDPVKGTTTDAYGKFVLEEVPVGRHDVQVSFMGYKTAVLPGILLTSAKEANLTVELIENVEQLNEVVVSADVEKRDAINQMATVSARQFSVEEAARYSGALQDPARMATNFAGVSGANDGRNDIIIRGNSPTGVLWRLEGIDIPSPNHFSTLGTTGGPVSMLNLNNLANSDFMTGAWSADYGNALSGVFDLKLREGSTNDYQFLGQVGFNGFELGAEGPFGKKKKASFMMNYRYSTLAVFQALGINLGTGAAVPQYQDITFKLALPTEKAGKFTVFGIAGTSFIEFKGQDSDSSNLFADAFTDSRWESTTAVVGASHAYFFDKNTLSKLVLAVSYTGEIGKQDSLSNDYSESYLSYGKKLSQIKYSTNYKINKKFNARNTATIGAIYDHYEIDLTDSTRSNNSFITLTEAKGGIDMLQLYALWQHRIGALWTFNLGVHNQTLMQNGSNSLEPRVGVKYNPFQKHTFSYAMGLHSQMQPLMVYFAEDPDGIVPGQTNKGLDFTKSAQFVIGHDYAMKKDLRLKTEAYYTYLYDVPVESTPSSYSMLNQGADFFFENRIYQVNEGEGYNYGLELTLEKFFSKGYYFLTTVSLFDSKYKGSDGVERSTAFNSNYVVNALGGKEFKVGKKYSLSFDTKVSVAGGQRYTPIDLEESIKRNREYRDDNLAYSEQFDPYFRWDFKITLRQNGSKFSQQFSVDLQNLTNQQNVFAYGYNPKSQTVATTYQRGFFPDVQWKIFF